MANLGAPASSSQTDSGSGVRAIVVAPTRELAHQIHNECLKLAMGRKWRIILFSKATASTLTEKNVREKICQLYSPVLVIITELFVDIIISTPLRLVAALQSGTLELNK